MTEVPKIVYDRLRADRSEQALPGPTAPEPAHPDADLLTAFAEQTLSATERDGVLEHLALCGDCREVVALALPDAGMMAPPTTADTEAVRATATLAWLSSPKLAWPGLRWAALAAGIAVAASVLLLHPGKQNQAMLPSTNQQVAPAALPAAGPEIVSSPVASSPVASSQMTSSATDQSSVSAKAASVKTDAARTKPELRSSKKLQAGQAGPPSPQVQSGMLLAYNRSDAGLGNKQLPMPSPAAPVAESGGLARQGVTESVEVAGAAEAVAVEPSSEGTLTARDTAPAIEKIEKAKPALQEGAIGPQKTEAAVGAPSAMVQARNVMSAAKLAPSPNHTLAHNVMWAIAAGVLQRSRDSGQTWQDALRADHSLLCYASHNADVWTGGQAGTLFHSVDSGVTWLQVQPSSKGQALGSDVTRIDLRDNVRGGTEVVVSTSNNESWSSADGGKTWEKK
jgi:hypothetical protein